MSRKPCNCKCKIDLKAMTRLRFGFKNFRKELRKQSPGMITCIIDVSKKTVLATVESILSGYKPGTYFLMVSNRGRLMIITSDLSLLRDIRSAKKFAK